MKRIDAGLGRSRQRDLVTYWNSKCGQAGLPSRRDLNPGELRAHLASLSIIHVDPDGNMRFRLAGSGIVRYLGRDVKGCGFSVLPEAQQSWWIRQARKALDKKAPITGFRKGNKADHAWMRAPLIGDEGVVDLVLCHDQIVPHTLLQDNRPTNTARGTQVFGGLAA